MTMLTKIKSYAVLIGTIALMFITLGGYARYQKRRAEKAEDEAEENKRMVEQAQAIEQRMHKAKENNYKAREQVNERKSNRTFFDNL